MIQVKLEFKTPKQEKDFYQVDPRIQAIVLFAAFNMMELWKYQAVITSVQRDEAEQAALIKQGLGEQNSPHLHWRAADIRLKDFPKKAHISVLQDLINVTFPRKDGFKTALAHGSGDSLHLHLQVPQERRF